MKLSAWRDLFKWQDEVISDDYNDGQLMVVKVKTKTENSGDLSITAKHAHPKKGETTSKLATELKLKQKYAQGTSVEWAMKNSGLQNATVEIISDLKWANLDLGKLNSVYKMNGHSDHQVGLELKDKETIGRGMLKLSQDSPALLGEFVHKVANDMNIGANFEIKTKDMGLDQHKWQLAGSHQVGEGKITGARLTLTGQETNVELKSLELFALLDSLKQHNQSWASESTWDLQKNTVSSRIGVLYKGDGYQTRFKVDDQGAIRGQLKWQLHPSTSAVLHSESHINSILNQSAETPKVGLAFEVKL